MSDIKNRAVEFAQRSVTNIKKNLARSESIHAAPMSVAMGARMAEQYSRDVEALEVWEYLLKCAKSQP